jgi:hypothetical protein
MAVARGIRLINGKEPVLKVLRLTVEYDSGELYYDWCGRVIRRLADLEVGWLRDAKANPGKTLVLNAERELVLEFNSSAAHVVHSMDGYKRDIAPETAERFATDASEAIRAVTDELDIPSFQRISYREQYAFPTESVEATEEWIRGLGLVAVAPQLYGAFAGEHYASSWAVVLAGDACRYRIAIDGQERSAAVPVSGAEVTVRESAAKHLKKSELIKVLKAKRDQQRDPEYFATLQIEAFLWDELKSDHDIGGFVKARAATNLNLFRNAVLPPQGAK